MSDHVRFLTPADRQPFVDAFLAVKAKPGCPGWAREVDEHSLFAALVKHEAIILMETYLVLVSKDKPWYASWYALSENIVLRVYRDGPATFADYVDFLKYAAKMAECRYISVGTALSTTKHTLAGKYQQHGFRVESFELSLEV